MFNVGGGEILLILLIALIVLGPDKLPDFSRKVGGVVREVRRFAGGFQDEMRRAMEPEPVKQSPAVPTPTSPGPAEATAAGDAADPGGAPHPPSGGEEPTGESRQEAPEDAGGPSAA